MPARHQNAAEFPHKDWAKPRNHGIKSGEKREKSVMIVNIGINKTLKSFTEPKQEDGTR